MKKLLASLALAVLSVAGVSVAVAQPTGAIIALKPNVQLAAVRTCRAYGMNGGYENRPVIYATCTSGTAQLRAYFVTKTGIPYMKGPATVRVGQTTYLYGAPGERYWAATLS